MTFGGVILKEVPMDYWAQLAGTVALVVALATIGVRRRRVVRNVLLAGAGLLLVRLLLLGNPWAWQFYLEKLDPGVIGWRQYDLVEIERERFSEPGAGLRYLAVGSSQTGAVYDRYAEAHGDFDTFVVAAMMPMDFVLYADDIVRRQPETVLLYLSDFDVAKSPSPEAAVLSPRQGANLFGVMSLLRSSPDAGMRGVIAELAVGEVLPEFRFRFIFRGLLDKQFRRVALRLGRREARQKVPSTEPERIGWLRDSLHPEDVPFNLACLQEFLDIMDRNGIRTVMVEGHYHPVVVNRELAAMNGRVRQELMRLAATRPAVAFIPRMDLHGLGADDYADLTHVKPEAGEEFTRQLLDLLEQPLTSAESAP